MTIPCATLSICYWTHSDQIIKNTKDKIVNAEYHHDQLLLESLTLPKRKIREGLFALIEKMNIKDIDTVQFTRESD